MLSYEHEPDWQLLPALFLPVLQPLSRLHMKPRSPLATRWALASLCSLASMALAQAQSVSVSTDPVGFIPIAAKGNSDTYVTIPLHRPALFRGAVASAAANGVVTVNQASFTDDQLNNRHYLLVTSGTQEGKWFRIVDTVAPNQVVVANDGEDLEATAGAGTKIQIVPFWTLNTAFPEGAGVHASDSFAPKSWVLLPDQTTTGTNLATESSFFYYSGSLFEGEGWRKVGAATTVKFDDQVLLPDSHVIVRHEIATDTVVVCPGAVKMAPAAAIVRTFANNRAQDNPVTFNVAVPTSLAASLLSESGAFASSTTIGTPADQLLVFDNTQAGKNKAPVATYYHYKGSSNGGDGWRLLGGNADTKYDTELVFRPSYGYIIRKAATATAGKSVWKMKPTYLP